MLEEWKQKFQEQKDKGLKWGKGSQGKYLLVIIVSLGLLALLWPTASQPSSVKDAGTAQPEAAVSANSDYKAKMTSELENILSKVAGAGQVKVSLSFTSDGLKTYAANVREEKRDVTENNTSQGSKKTVEEAMNKDIAVSGSSPLLVENKVPEVTGVLVVAEGAKNAAVKEELIKATATLLHIPYHKVEVVAKEGGI